MHFNLEIIIIIIIIIIMVTLYFKVQFSLLTNH